MDLLLYRRLSARKCFLGTLENDDRKVGKSQSYSNCIMPSFLILQLCLAFDVLLNSVSFSFRVFILEVPIDSVIERLTQRATDPVTGERYHMLYNPPRTQEVKDRLVRHPRDEDAAVHKRLAQYHSYIEELSDYYTDAQHIIADQDPHTVFECLESMIVKPLPHRA